MAWKRMLKRVYWAVRNSRLLWTYSRRKILPDYPCQQLRVHSSRPLPILPWSEILPFRSIRVNLTEAQRKGWALDRTEDFPDLLEAHVAQWKSEGRSAVWLHLPLSLCSLVPLAAEAGFHLHHGRGEEVVMNRWLLEHKPSKLPHYASHQVGVCGVVYREDTGELLVTQDKFKFAKWKFPGGLSEHAEDIAETAVREVREETGVHTEFQSVLAFRQHHHMPNAFDCSDLYFICRLRPLNYDLQPCQDEVLKCQWMKLEELAVTKETTLLTHRISRLLLDGRGKPGGFSSLDIAMEELASVYPKMTYKLFLRAAPDR